MIFHGRLKWKYRIPFVENNGRNNLAIITRGTKNLTVAQSTTSMENRGICQNGF